MNDVETFAHELGHGLQHMLTEARHEDVAGIENVEWDAVEIASQFMEYWMYQPEVLKKMTAHMETGAPMPDEMIEKIRKSRTFFGANAMLRQILLAATDLELYHRYDHKKTTETPNDVYLRKARELTVYPPFEDGRMLNSFNHIFAGGYAAGYYSYKWAEVMAADIFSAFEGHLDDPAAIRAIGQRLKETLYGLGGSVHPAEVFRRFMGRGYSIEALLRHSGLVDG
ncbi:MAG: hypothetical protein HQM16_10520 [Deltaproteobacteria bacterium]|nr:hypothetical protein [Deltaproteobacteria bacterium]